LLRPAVYLDTAAGEIPVEPYGKPANYGPVAAIVATAVAGIGAWLMWRGVRAVLDR